MQQTLSILSTTFVYKKKKGNLGDDSCLEKSLEENVAAMFSYLKEQRNNTKGNSSGNVADLIDSIIKFKEVGII